MMCRVSDYNFPHFVSIFGDMFFLFVIEDSLFYCGVYFLFVIEDFLFSLCVGCDPFVSVLKGKKNSIFTGVI